MSVIADAYLAGVSTRRVEKLVQQLGVERMSKSQVSRLAQSLDEIVEDFRTRPLDGGPYAYVTFDALGGQVPRGRPHGQRLRRARGRRQPGRLPRVARPRRRHQPRTAPPGSRSCAAWSRAASAGVRLVTSDAHPGLVDAIAATLPGAAWQRCRTHAMRNLLTRVPEERPGVRRDDGAHDLRPARRRHGPRAAPPDRRPARSSASPKPPRCSTKRHPTCSPSPRSRRSTGGSSGATTRSSGSTRRSAAAPTSSASSPTAPPSSASSAPSSPNRTTSGPSPAAAT